MDSMISSLKAIPRKNKNKDMAQDEKTMSMSELERITKKVEVIRKRQRIRRMIEENLISETQGNEMLSRYKKNEDDSDQDSETEEETANDEFGLESMRLAATFSRKDYNKFLETAGQ